MAATDQVGAVNSNIVNSITSIKWMYILGWIFAGIIVVAAGWWGYVAYKNKKIYNKKITAFEISGEHFVPTLRDEAKVIKIGTGGFEILYLKRLKTWKIAYGGRVGVSTYYFFIMPDGYWYNAMLSANMFVVNSLGGLIPVVTTNPSMRSQYTSLEKQIDSLHANKQSFFEKYGAWIAAIGFVMIAGVMLWLSYGEYTKAMGTLTVVVDKIGILIDKINVLQGNSAIQAGAGGLVPGK